MDDQGIPLGPARIRHRAVASQKEKRVNFSKLFDMIDTDPALWQKIMDSNLTGAFLCSRRAAKIMSGQNQWVSNEDIHVQIVKGIPLGRLAEPGDIVHPVLFLCSDMSSYITGQTIMVDGGSSAI